MSWSLFVISEDGETIHRAEVESLTDLSAVQAFGRREIIHGWRVTPEATHQRDAAIQATPGKVAPEPVATHKTAKDLFEAIGYDNAAKALCTRRSRQFRAAALRASPDGRRMPWIDDKPYRVKLQPKAER